MSVDMSRYVARFLEEAREQLRLLQEGLASWQEKPADPETADELFRSAHTIRGAAGMLKLKPVAETARHLEEALSALREGAIPYSLPLAHLLSRCAATLLIQLQAAEQGSEAGFDHELCLALASASTATGSAPGITNHGN